MGVMGGGFFGRGEEDEGWELGSGDGGGSMEECL